MQEGRYVYCGHRPTTVMVVNELLRLAAISILYRDGHPTRTTYYGINDIGRSLLRRPELEDELRKVFSAKKRRAFSVINDKIEFIE